MTTENIERTILNEISKTEKQILDYRELTKPIAPDVSLGRISRMDAINNKSVMEASLRQAEGKLKNLQSILSKAGTKDFGLCIKCKQAIPLARILIRPESLYCVNCAV